jgi:hypothetical protein
VACEAEFWGGGVKNRSDAFFVGICINVVLCVINACCCYVVVAMV